jgi:hypothetical protein
MLPYTLDDLAARFTACTLPKEHWTHVAHLSVGAWHVDRYGAQAALGMLRTGIRRLNDSHGVANSSTSGYHETITIAYVQLIDAFLASFPDPTPLDMRVATLVEGPLADKALLLRFWSRDLLMSAAARSEWVPPDLAPLTLSASRSNV